MIDDLLGLIFGIAAEGAGEAFQTRREKRKARKRTKAVSAGKDVKFGGGIKNVNSRYGWQPLAVNLVGDDAHFSCTLFAVHVTRQEPSFIILTEALREEYELTKDLMKIGRFEKPGVPVVFGLADLDWITFETWLDYRTSND